MVLCKRSKTNYNKRLDKLVDFKINNIKYAEPRSNKSIAIISSPASMHISDSIYLLKKGFNLLIEKPLSINMDKLRKLSTLATKHKLKIMIGFNYRYSEIIKRVNKILLKKTIGNIRNVMIHIGTNFKIWRKHLNYEKSVTASKKFGGGAIFELSHEIDYMYFLFGKPTNVHTYSNNTIKGLLVETKVLSTFQYKDSDFIITVHQDLFTNYESRYCIVEADKGSLTIDLTNNQIVLNKYSNNKKNIYFNKDKNDMYQSEIKNLVYCIKNNKEPTSNLEDGIQVQSILNAMHKSSNLNKRVTI